MVMVEEMEVFFCRLCCTEVMCQTEKYCAWKDLSLQIHSNGCHWYIIHVWNLPRYLISCFCWFQCFDWQRTEEIQGKITFSPWKFWFLVKGFLSLKEPFWYGAFSLREQKVCLLYMHEIHHYVGCGVGGIMMYLMFSWCFLWANSDSAWIVVSLKKG